MNKVVLKKCDHAAIKKAGQKLSWVAKAGFISRLSGRHGFAIRAHARTTEKTGIHPVRFPHWMVPAICKNAAIKNDMEEIMMAKAGIRRLVKRPKTATASWGNSAPKVPILFMQWAVIQSPEYLKR